MCKRALSFFWAIAFICWAGMVNSSVILDYRGNNFESVSLSGPTAPADIYTTSDRVTGWIELATPLSPDLAVEFVTPLSFSFSDGVSTITDTTATSSLFVFSTDAVGEVVGWDVVADNSSFAPGGFNRLIVSTTGLGVASLDVYDSGSELLCGPDSVPNINCNPNSNPGYAQSAIVSDAPGTWNYRVPTPATLVLMGLGLAGIGYQRRKMIKSV